MSTDQINSFLPDPYWSASQSDLASSAMPVGEFFSRWCRTIVMTLIMFLAGVSSGVLWRHVSTWPEEAFLDAKANLREAIGLSKNWHVLPVVHGAHQKVACPDPATALVIVTGGQSNSANANSALSSTSPDQHVYDWHDNACYVSADPVPGATGTKGSLWPLIGADIAAGIGRPVVMVHGGIGGSQAGDWLDSRSSYYAALMSEVKGARAAGFEPRLVFWHQGETDAARHPDPAELSSTFGTLMDNLLSDLPETRVYLFKASKCIGRHRDDGVSAVRDAQTAAAAHRPRVIEGFDTDALGNDYRWDTCHFNSLGRDAIRAAVVPQVVALFDPKRI